MTLQETILAYLRSSEERFPLRQVLPLIYAGYPNASLGVDNYTGPLADALKTIDDPEWDDLVSVLTFPGAIELHLDPNDPDVDCDDDECLPYYVHLECS